MLQLVLSTIAVAVGVAWVLSQRQGTVESAPTVIEGPAPAPADVAVEPAHQMSPDLQRLLDRTLRLGERIPSDLTYRVPAVDEAELPVVLEALQDPTEGDAVRNECVSLLARANTPDLVGRLIRLLPKERGRFRGFLAQHLGLIARGQAVEATRARYALCDLVHDHDTATRREATQALATIGDQVGVTALQTALEAAPHNDGLLDLAVRFATDDGDERHRAIVRSLVNSNDEQVAVAAIYVAGEWRDSLVTADVRKACQCSRVGVRQAAGVALRKIAQQ